MEEGNSQFKLAVPQVFLDCLKAITLKVEARHVVTWLKWASQNQKAAVFFAEEFEKLGKLGRREVGTFLRFGDSPLLAIKFATERDRKYRKHRSLISKVVAHTKKRGFQIKMKNGAVCFITYNNGEEQYWFTFQVDGEQITIVYGKRGLGWALKLLQNEEISFYRAKAFLYKQAKYSPTSRMAKILFHAIKNNVKPELVMLLHPPQS